jgi:hypothetical protein
VAVARLENPPGQHRDFLSWLKPSGGERGTRNTICNMQYAICTAACPFLAFRLFPFAFCLWCHALRTSTSTSTSYALRATPYALRDVRPATATCDVVGHFFVLVSIDHRARSVSRCWAPYVLLPSGVSKLPRSSPEGWRGEIPAPQVSWPGRP